MSDTDNTNPAGAAPAVTPAPSPAPAPSTMTFDLPTTPATVMEPGFEFTTAAVSPAIPPVTPATTEAAQAADPTAEMASTAENIPVLDEWPVGNDTLQEAEIYVKPKDGKLPDGLLVSMPTTTAARTEKVLDSMPNLEYEKSPGGQAWANTISESAGSLAFDDSFRETADRSDAVWRQSVRSEKGQMGAGRPSFKQDGPNLTGEKAVLHVRALMGLGSVVQIPLWHSGFWVTIKAPTESALLELNRRLTEEKISLGRSTHGLAFANTSVFFAGWLSDFIIAHIYDTSLNPEVRAAKSLRERIRSLDLHILAWGMACAIWPTGFPYARAVFDSTGTKTETVKEMLNVSKLLWTDTSSLTPWQISHMANRMGNSMTEQALERYQGDFIRGQGRKVKLSENMALMTKVPSLQEYIAIGHKWVNNIAASVDKAFQFENLDERDQYIVDQGKATNMRQYLHWVKHLEVGEEAKIVDHDETMESIVDVMSSQDELRKNFFAGVRSFIEDSTIAIIAVPATEATDQGTLPRFAHLLPLDAMHVFFTLLVQKTIQIRNRR